MTDSRFAISNIALPAYDHTAYLPAIADLGIRGLEVAPSRVWQDTWGGLSPSDVAAYRRSVEAAELQVVGFHSLFFDHPDMGIFKDPSMRKRTLDFLVHLSGVCRDLGGRTLIYGGGRRREGQSAEDATAIALDFLSEFVGKIAEHGTCLCFEPLGPEDTDFVNSAYESLELVKQIDHAAFRVQLDAKALVTNNEVSEAVFTDCHSHLVHFHVNEPGLDVLGATGTIDHAFLGAQLRRIQYDGFISIEQKMLDALDPLCSIRTSAEALHLHYGTH